MNPEQWLSLKWNGGSTMSDRWLNQSKIIQKLSRYKDFVIPVTLIHKCVLKFHRIHFYMDNDCTA